MKRRSNWITAALFAGLLGCGGSSDPRPEGRYQLNESLAFSQGCKEEFSAWLVSNAGGAQPTEWIVNLKRTGSQSVIVTLEGGSGISMTLAPASEEGDEEDTWVGTKTGAVTISGCALAEELSVGLKAEEGDTILIGVVDAWSNVSLSGSCPWATGDCINEFVVRGKKV